MPVDLRCSAGMSRTGRLGGMVGVAAVLPVTRALSLGGRVANAAATATFDALLESRTTAQLVDRLIDSPLVERALGRALEGPLVEALGRDVVRYAVVERVAEAILTDEAIDAMLDRI